VIAAASDAFAPATLGACGLGLALLPLWWRLVRRRELAPVTPLRSSTDAVWPVPAGFAVFIAYSVLMALAVGAIQKSRAEFQSGQFEQARALLVLARVWIGVAVVVGLAAAGWALPRLSRATISVWHGIGAGFLTFLVAMPVVYGIAFVESLVFGELPPQKMVDMIRGSAEGARELVVLAIIVAPLLEEIIFRGFFWAGLRRTRGPRFALVFTAVLFGIVHLDPPAAVLPMMAFGYFLGVLMERTGSLVACFVAHAAFNTLSIVTLQLS